MLSVLDIFRIGIGPSSSHTVGPMRIARTFVRGLDKAGKLEKTARVAIELQGSLALTGVGHGTVDASMLGLMGFVPDKTCPDEADKALAVAQRCNVKPIIACSLALRAHAKLLQDGEAALGPAGEEIAEAARIIEESRSFAYRGEVVRAQKALAEVGVSATA